MKNEGNKNCMQLYSFFHLTFIVFIIIKPYTFCIYNLKYRRTRRQISPKPADHVEYSANPNNTEVNEQNTDENSNTLVNNCNDSRKIGKTFPREMNEFKETTTFDLKDSFHTEMNSSLNHIKTIERVNQELAISKSENSKETFTERLKQHSTPPQNYNVPKRNLNRSPEYLALSDSITNSPTTFVNIRNESEGGNMPVILNVFTLSQVPTSYIKHKITNVMRKNNFPVTPPCSSPIQKLEQFIGTQNTPSETKTPLFPSGLASPTLKKSTTTSNVYNIYFPVNNGRQNVTGGGHLFPSGIKQSIDQTNYTPTSQLTRFYDVNGGAKIKQSKLSIVSSSKNNAVLCDSWKLMTQPLKNVEVSPVTEFTGKPSYSRAQCVGESENGGDDSHVFLSPTDIKVLQLKRRLKEQEAALKKLRTNH